MRIYSQVKQLKELELTSTQLINFIILYLKAVGLITLVEIQVTREIMVYCQYGQPSKKTIHYRSIGII